MMSAQMLAAASNNAEQAAAPDSMKMLDAEADEPRQPVVSYFSFILSPHYFNSLFLIAGCQTFGSSWKQHYVCSKRNAARHNGRRN